MDDSVWDHESAVRNQILMGVPAVIGTYAIARYRAKKLLLYVPAVVLFLTYWRRYVCARCQYYGRECSTMLGIMTSRMMPPDESKALDRNAMIKDFAFVGLIALMPMPQAFKKTRLGLAYLLSLLIATSALFFSACGRCQNDFCPMKDVHKKLLG